MLKLLESSDIGNMHLRNRIFLCPMGTTTDFDGGFSKTNVKYYEEVAKGGTALIYCSMAITNKFNDCVSFLFDNASFVPRLSTLIDHVHQQGAKFCAQLVPGMGRNTYYPASRPIYSSSATKAFFDPNVTCIPYTVDDIKVLAEAMHTAAVRAKMAGADAIEIHAYGGYLTDQFMCSLWNLRTDEYGGDLQGRMKLLLEFVQAVRSAVGSNFPIICKFTPYHGIPGGRELPEGIEIAKMLEAAGVTALHVNTGCYETIWYTISTTYDPEGYELDLTAAVKDAVSIPVLGQGKLWDPAVAEKALQDGKLDYVGLGHQLMADHEWPKKVKEGRIYDIRHCLGCNECINSRFVGADMRCAVNPRFMHDDEYPLTPAKEKKSILVIGGGAGGLSAANTAAERGFSVELWEKSNELGGNLISAGAPAFKKDVKVYMEYAINKAYRTGVNVRLMKDVSPEEIIAGNFDKVILATGSKPILPRIPGIDGPNVKIFDEVLTGGAEVGKKIVVIGGGHVGCETALHLKQTGAAEVTIVEMLDDILATAVFAHNISLRIRNMIAGSGIKVITGATVTEILKSGVVYAKDGSEVKLDCDTVVIAVGLTSDNNLEKALEGKVKDLAVIGDAVNARKVISAVHEGFHAARVID